MIPLKYHSLQNLSADATKVYLDQLDLQVRTFPLLVYINHARLAATLTSEHSFCDGT
jgi:hypothetical protein